MKEKTPRKQQYIMPPEWHPHAATQLHWPSNCKTWPGKRLQKVEAVYLNIIQVLHQYEPIHLFINSEQKRDYACNLFTQAAIDLENIIFHIQPINDVWARDSGPIFIRREHQGKEEFAITDWEYNAWGQKYPPFDDDNRLPEYLAEKFNIHRFKIEMVLEGGSIETNGGGILLTTESVLLNPNRNPELSKKEIEQYLKDYLGVQKIIWLKNGLAGDDTNGHIDDVARFLNENTILAMVTSDVNNVNNESLQENLKILRKSTNQYGEPFKLETLILPETKISDTTVDGSQYIPASYANFYVANGLVLVPTYDDKYDQEALTLFERYFPDRKVIGIPCTDLVWGQGSIHCITQQLYGLNSEQMVS